MLGSPYRVTGGGAGTPGYMAPEQALGQPVGKPADVYALGVLLAELALGARPEPDPLVTEGSLLKKWPPLRQLPKDLRRLIERCTDAVPARRPADAPALQQQFQPFAPSSSSSPEPAAG